VTKMKKHISILMAAILMATVFSLAAAEEKSSLSDFSNRLKKNVSVTAAGAGDQNEDEGTSYGPAVRNEDPFFEKVQSAAYLREDKYSKEMNVFIELKNTSGRALYPSKASIEVYDAAGNMLEEKTYASVGPDMVNNGDSLYIWEWFYGPDYALESVSYFVAKVETETSSYREFENIEGQALVDSGIAYALIENTTDSDIYGVCVLVAVKNDEGRLLDVCEVSTGNAVGVFPQSVMILRGNVEDHEKNEPLTGGNAVVQAIHQID